MQFKKRFLRVHKKDITYIIRLFFYQYLVNIQLRAMYKL